MLRLYAGRENINKERFIYENIRGEALVIVPNQYTLVAEEQALRYSGRDCLFDVEILSMNRLGLRLLTEQGKESVNMLDRYGRFMLLTRIIREHAEEFDIFRKSAGKQAFTNMLSDFISEFKQNECEFETISSILDDESADPILRAKLSEVSIVLDAYEEAIAGKYKDSEEYINDYIDAIPDSRLVKGKTIWIYGYDSITPKFERAMLALAGAAESVNFILNRSEEPLDEMIECELRERCRESGIDYSCEEIGSEYELGKSGVIRLIEDQLFRNVPEPAVYLNSEETAPAVKNSARYIRHDDLDDLRVVCASNPYYEAESAASYIWHLVRDLGYKMRDIQVISNDEGNMHPIIKRVFAEYGLPVFMDSSRNITDTAPVSFIVNLLWFIIYNKNQQYLFAMLKTGLAGISEEVIEDLENYVRSYKIRGSMWDRDFKYGEEALGTELFSELNSVRAEIMGKVNRLEQLVKHVKRPETDVADDGDGEKSFASGISDDHDGKMRVDSFVRSFVEYLNDVWGLDEAVQSMADEEEDMGYIDEAQRTVESYNKAIEMLGQITEIMGSSELDLKEFTEIYAAGLTNVEVGVIPPAADGLSVGTMIRTRPRPIRAAVILGANEGILPMQPSTEGLFSIDEKEYFSEKGFALGSLSKIKESEENAAMYRMMSKPSDKLYISYSLTDEEGKEAAPSTVIESLRNLFPHLGQGGIVRDAISMGWGGGSVSDFLNTSDESMRHMIDRIKDRNAPEELEPQVKALLSWYDKNRKEELDTMLAAASDQNEQKPLRAEVARSLFGRSDGSLVLSASAIGGYFDCPFRFYIDRGLKPREEREFASDPRSIGDAYHECLMAVARRLLGDRTILSALDAAKRRKNSNSEENAENRKDTILEETAENRKDTILEETAENRKDTILEETAENRKDTILEETAENRKDPNLPDTVISTYSAMRIDVLPDAEAPKNKAERESLDMSALSNESINALSEDDLYKLIEEMVDEELARIASEYNGGLFISAGSERYRMSRIREICSGAARAMADQLSGESLVEADFEEKFGRGGKFEPIAFEVDGQQVYVEGKIDRSDILSVDGIDRVRIIDYKTGSDSLDIWKMRHGYKMQLMIYMISAASGDLEPAGLFYFNIKDPIEGADSKSDSALKSVKDREPGDTYKLRGRFIDEPGVLDAMPADVITGGRGINDRKITREEYEEIRHDVMTQIEKTASGILRGDISIHPLKDKNGLVCSRCRYKPICKRDREYTRNYPREIPAEPKKPKENEKTREAK